MGKKSLYTPFQPGDKFFCAGLYFDNPTTHSIRISGSSDITRDKDGLRAAETIASQIRDIIEFMPPPGIKETTSTALVLPDVFCNESESLQCEGLTVENRLDRVTIYGEITVGLDPKGSQNILLLLDLFTKIGVFLRKEDNAGTLPARLTFEAPVAAVNPFE